MSIKNEALLYIRADARVQSAQLIDNLRWNRVNMGYGSKATKESRNKVTNPNPYITISYRLTTVTKTHYENLSISIIRLVVIWHTTSVNIERF
jgi:hypothetical protein